MRAMGTAMKIFRTSGPSQLFLCDSGQARGESSSQKRTSERPGSLIGQGGPWGAIGDRRTQYEKLRGI
jgi:hypothetical protein